MTAQQRYNKRHHGRRLATVKRWQVNNRAAWLAGRRRQYRKYRDANTETLRKKNRLAMRRWRAANRIKARANNATSQYARRARKYGTQANLTGINKFIARIRRKRRVRCYYCKLFTAGKTAHIDHIVPLNRGGHHVMSNLCASCPTCNLTKNTKLISDFHPTPQRLLPI